MVMAARRGDGTFGVHRIGTAEPGLGSAGWHADRRVVE